MVAEIVYVPLMLVMVPGAVALESTVVAVVALSMTFEETLALAEKHALQPGQWVN
jgi:hypothetical protein